MHVTTGPARYFFLRQTNGAKEDVPNWPPEIRPLREPENLVCVAVYLSAEEHGWRAEPVRMEQEQRADAGGAFVLTRETTLGLSPEGRRGTTALELLGVRVALAGESGPEHATHLVVRAQAAGLTTQKAPVVVPIDGLVLAGYLEHGHSAEAQLDLRLSAGELASMPPYLPDSMIERAADRALDAVILSERQRHEIKLEVIAGRVTLYGTAELTTIGEVARSELENTPGVVEVLDRLTYSELLTEQVHEQLAARGYDDIDINYENGLIELLGTVSTSSDIHTLRDLVLRVTGVRGVVVNQVAVRAPAVSATAGTVSAVSTANDARRAQPAAMENGAHAGPPSTPNTATDAPATGAAATDAPAADASQAGVSGNTRG